MNFCEILWEENQQILQKIIEMPFLQKMHEGSLESKIFYYYIEQDINYLKDYAEAVSYLITKSDNKAQIELFLDMIKGTFEEQEKIHAQYTLKIDFKMTDLFTPAYKQYRDFILLNCATKPLPIAYTSIMACPWLYIYVGEYFTNKGFKNDIYQYWFEANCTKEVVFFLQQQKTQLELFAKEHPSYREEMKKIFKEALLLEYKFWNDAYLLKRGDIL